MPVPPTLVTVPGAAPLRVVVVTSSAYTFDHLTELDPKLNALSILGPTAPLTSNLNAAGLFVPIPTLPVDCINNAGLVNVVPPTNVEGVISNELSTLY